MRQPMRFNLIFGVFLFVFFPIISTADFPDIRGLWVVRHALTSPRGIDEMLQLANDCYLTDLFVQVRGRGDAYYRSNYEPKAEDVVDPEFDPLEYILNHPRRNGLRIHAWVNVFYVWSQENLPADQNHIVNRRSDWLAQPSKFPPLLSDYPHSLKNVNVEGLFVSPLLPEVQQNFLDIVNDILSRYPVDGLHLDYIRFPGPAFDLHPDVVRNFRNRFILNPRYFLEDAETFAQKFSLEGYQSFYYHWRKYLMDGLSDFVKRLHQYVESRYPDVRLTAAVKPDLTRAHWDYYQAWDRWIEEGWLDYAIPMNYTPDGNVFLQRLTEYIEKLDSDKYLMGIALYNKSEEQIIRQMIQTVELGNPGFVLFSYEQLKQQSKVQNYLKNGSLQR